MNTKAAEASARPSFIERLTKVQQERLRTVWQRWEEAKIIMRTKGALIPTGFAARLANVSRQRINQIVEDGRLERVEIDGHFFITEKSFDAWVASERKAGRRVTEHLPPGVVGKGKWLAKNASEHVNEKEY
jgi:hypothetical protein